MPTYQYSCTDCGHFLEVFQSFSDDSLTECPECGGKLRKVFNAVGVVFKGSGFYRTDSRAGGASGAGTSAPAKSAETTTSGTSGTPAKSGGDSGSSSSAGSTTGTGSTTTSTNKTAG